MEFLHYFTQCYSNLNSVHILLKSSAPMGALLHPNFVSQRKYTKILVHILLEGRIYPSLKF